MSDKPQEQETSEDTAGRFGTFGGVFTPCVLTILGVIMFMRSGFVVGDVGFLGALGILAIAKVITTLTTLSLSAIATNTEVKTGGVYYMISRTLGPDFGGAIGLTLFVSQAISIAFYVIGFSEALFGLLPGPGTELGQTFATFHVPQLVSTGMVLLLFMVTFKGADVAIKAQYFILGALLISVVTFLIGGVLAFDITTFESTQTARESSSGFWIAFAIFFPAATGITAGANMSGDLKSPGIAIPRGTFLAIGFTAIVYVIELVLLAGHPDPGGGSTSEWLAGDSFGALKTMSIFPPMIVVGVFAATLSSALGSFLGAPRILQAMGQDKLLEVLGYFGKGHGKNNEPRRATVLSLLIAVAIVWAGGLDAIAQVISMFFLIAYGMINLSAFVEGRSGNPSFRPRFKLFGWPAALIGTIGCVIAMIKIDESYAIVAMIIAAAVYFFLRGRAQSDWGDAKRGYIFARTRENLLLLEKSKPDPKNWRPAMVVITDDVVRERQLITVGSWIESGRGILSVLEITEHAGDVHERINVREERITQVRLSLADRNIVAFSDSVVVENAKQSFDTVLQSYSIGSLRPNTIMASIPPPDKTERRANLISMMRSIAAFNANVVLYKGAKRDSPKQKSIDLWWHGQLNGSLMSLFAYLTSIHPDWQKSKIRLCLLYTSPSPRDATLSRMPSSA